MITCRELIEFLDDYVGGQMDNGRRRAADEHLAVCPDCVNYLESYRMTVAVSRAALKRDEDAVIPKTVPPELIKAVLASRRDSK
jgi:anti-sigma factor RsiW